MRVLIDARMVGPVGHGIARYVRGIGKGLKRVQSLKGGELGYEPVFLVSPNFPQDPASQDSGFEGFEMLFSHSKFLSPREWVDLSVEISRSRADLYHSPSHSVPMVSPVPWLVTLHDLNHLHFGSKLKKLYMEHVLRRRVERAARVMSVSQTSAREIASWLDRKPSEIEVVPNAISPDFADELSVSLIDQVCGEMGVKRGEYFFCLSNPKPHKNIGLLVEAHRRYQLSSRGVGVAYPLVTSFEWGEPSMGMISAPRLSDFQARALIKGARALCFPSIYEGFGLPPVEALISGTPVILSDIPPHREALDRFGNTPGVHWVGPHDVQGWIEAFALHPEAVPTETRRGLLSLYSIERLGNHMDRIYRVMLGLS